jgi:hypothetical protein
LFSPNEIVCPRKSSKGKYDKYNYVSKSPEIIEEEEQLFENDRLGGNFDSYSNFIREFNLIHSSGNKNQKNNQNNQNNKKDINRGDYDFNLYEQHCLFYLLI